MAATMNAATFMGKNFLDNQNSIKTSTDLTLKKMFDISEKLVSEQDEINNVDKIYWKNHSWKQLSLIGVVARKIGHPLSAKSNSILSSI